MADTPPTARVGSPPFVCGYALYRLCGEYRLGRAGGPPGIAGLIIAVVGSGVAFAINSAPFLAVLLGLAMMDPTALRKGPR